MKKAKRLVSLLLAFVMLLSLTVVVGAATTGESPKIKDLVVDNNSSTGTTTVPDGTSSTGSIKITNPINGEDYNLYQIL
jgi:hypothetical protein